MSDKLEIKNWKPARPAGGLKIRIFYFLFSIFYFLFSSSSYSQPNTFRHTYGGESHDHGRSVKQTFDGGYIVAGSTSSWGYGNSDVYVIKLDSLGIKQWSNVYGGSNVDWGYSIVQTPDSNYAVAGITNSFGAGGYDAYLIKIDTIGNLLWQKTYGGSDWDFTYSMQQTSDGGFILAGETYSYGNGNNDVYLIKTNASGDTAWTKTYGGIKEDYAKSVKQTFDGGYILAGATASFGAGKEDVYIIKTDALGDTVWVKTFGGDSADVANDITTISDTTGYLFVGTTSKGAFAKKDVSVYRIGINGNFMEQNFYGGIKDDEGMSIYYSDNSKVFVIGSTESYGEGGKDVILYRVNGNGNYIESYTFGTLSNEEAFSIIGVSDGGAVFTGYSDFLCSGYADVLIIKTNENGGTDSLDFFCFPDSIQIILNNSLPSMPDDIIVFPNPFNEKTTVYFSGNYSEFCIYNLMGEVIKTNSININQIEFSKDDFPSGIYFLILKNETGNSASVKLIAY